MNHPVPLVEDPAALFIVEALSRVPAGFPSPAQDHAQRRIDLNDVLVLNPLSTFLFNVEGDSMSGAGIWNGDKLVVDRSIDPKHGLIVLACVDGEFTVKRLYRRAGLAKLYKPGFRYAKAGVMLLDLTAPAVEQADLFTEPAPHRERLMAALDAVNDRFGRGTLRVGNVEGH
ncbi:LexA family protein [Burkholderia gladioli]|uniref:LexA family protein n=1 Tax=Burkholderia gladioli TaxID=28095 RepID=UPI001FC8C756|nr:translesion error-prone DNA polymerase V autoproteolytic subunit [Burkholderia gladioli]